MGAEGTGRLLPGGLATRHADIPHVVADGESGLLAPERDVDRLAANLAMLLKEPESWAARNRRMATG